MKILITGGHLTPALAIIDEILALKSRHKILFVGRKHTGEHERGTSFEFQEITGRNIRFIHLETGRLTRIFSLKSFKNLIKLPEGFLRAYNIVRKEKPDLILTFGSYIGLPLSLAGYLQGIPVYMHEQTLHPGAANQLIGQFAARVFVSFPEAGDYFDEKKVSVSGNPVRKQIFKILKPSFTVQKTKPVIYVTGGSLGSHSINELIEPIIKDLLQKYIIIHQTGNVEEYKDFERLNKLRNTLHEELKQRYIIRKHIMTDEIGYVYALADLVIGRSGANTFFELIALRKPAIFIPLPWSAHNEQQRQAEIFEKEGTGEIVSQTERSEVLFSVITSMMRDLSTYRDNFDKLLHLYKQNAVQIILTKHIPA